MEQQTAARIARFSTFATLGALGTTQDLARTCLESIEGADPEIVAEETLCLVATATARAAEVGLRDEPDVARAVVPVLLDLPYLYRDYLVGGAMLLQQNAALLDADDAVYRRLQRKREFYTVHLAPGQVPGTQVLNDKMGLWMGRISPSGLPEPPVERMEKLELMPLLLTHVKLVLAYGRKGSASS